MYAFKLKILGFTILKGGENYFKRSQFLVIKKKKKFRSTWN